VTRKFKGHEITLEENAVEGFSVFEDKVVEITHWVATLTGREFGKPNVEMRRKGKTANEAYENLRKAVEEQGWELP
jgi:hypothetical protein